MAGELGTPSPFADWLTKRLAALPKADSAFSREVIPRRAHPREKPSQDEDWRSDVEQEMKAAVSEPRLNPRLAKKRAELELAASDAHLRQDIHDVQDRLEVIEGCCCEILTSFVMWGMGSAST